MFPQHLSILGNNMELSSHDDEQAEENIPIPGNMTCLNHLIHHRHHHHPHPHPHPPLVSASSAAIASSALSLTNNNVIIPQPQQPTTTTTTTSSKNKRSSSVVRYMECLKNHAASFGGNATDGCGQFIPSGQDASIDDSLTCSACHCHRNFHRKLETICIHHHHPFTSFHNQHHYFNTNNNPLMHLSDHPTHYHHHNYNNNQQQPMGGVKKRHRTKFSQEHKDKMLAFAERVGWKLQKQEDSLVQQFCNEIGVKRRVLKVWMHNNKHTYYHHSTTPPAT